MQPVIRELSGLLTINSDATGRIRSTSVDTVKAQAGNTVQRYFVGSDLRSPFAADGVTPLAVYPAILNDALARVTWIAVEPHVAIMRKRLTPELFRWLELSNVREQLILNPLPVYESPHTWVDPRGYTLSDRIWQTSAEVRRKIDLILTNGIRNNLSALEISRQLEFALLPGRVGKRTTKPYGTNASFDALRLARTEITQAHSSASLAASKANPFVSGMDWALSARHPRADICDSIATIGMSGERLKEPYDIEGDVPTPPGSSHPQCICNMRPFVGRDARVVNQDLNAMRARGGAAPLTPAARNRFLEALLGSYLWGLIRSGVQ